jgi:hypothetical protein
VSPAVTFIPQQGSLGLSMFLPGLFTL